MNVLVTGSRGMVGTALLNCLKNLRDGKDRTRPNIHIEEIFEYHHGSSKEDLKRFCESCDFVFNMAGVNRAEQEAAFAEGNEGFARLLVNTLKECHNAVPVMYASSVQASLAGRFENSTYGVSKKASEQVFFEYSRETGVPVAVYRFPNVMGHSRPNYNSAVSTFCWAIANDETYVVHDENAELELLYIDDLVQGMLDLLEGNAVRCNYDGVIPLPCEAGDYYYVPTTYKVTLGYIVELLKRFKEQPNTLMMPEMPEASFEKKLCSLYLSYLSPHAFKYALKMNSDARGSFTELLHTPSCGQVSVNISKPGITKGQHWHSSKWEQFIVVKGHGLIQERNIVTGELVEFEVSGDVIEAVYMIPGWTHNIINLSETEELVTVMTCNEIFDPQHPDTYYEEV